MRRELALSVLAASSGAAEGYTCNYPKDKVGSIQDKCYHIYQGGAGTGLAERNCGDINGDIGFVFPRGFNAYYDDGYIAMVQFAVTKWGDYMRCNHDDGSTKYVCKKKRRLQAQDADGNVTETETELKDMPWDRRRRSDAGKYPYAGKEGAPRDGHWYSFPEIGKDKEWSSVGCLSDGCNCQVLRIKAKCLFSLMAKAGKCSSGCDGLSSDKCADCFSGLSLDKEKQLWHDAIWDKKCPRVYMNEDMVSIESNSTVGFAPDIDRSISWGFWRRPPFWNGTEADSKEDVVV